MEPSRKRKRLDEPDLKKNFKIYADKVNQKTEDGIFGEADLLAGTQDTELLEFKKREEFSIHALLHENMQTGWGMCSLCSTLPGRKKAFKISDGMSGLKLELIRRHCRNGHVSASDKQKAKAEKLREKAKNQPAMSEFLTRAQLLRRAQLFYFVYLLYNGSALHLDTLS